MKIEYSKNCTSDSLYYNDKDIFKMDQEQQKQIVLDLLNNVDIDFINLIKQITNQIMNRANNVVIILRNIY